MKKALFVTFEGGEGSGKSSHIRYVVSWLRKKGLKVACFREPGSTKTGEKIRRILLYSREELAPLTELLLYLSARLQLITQKLKKAFLEYDVVICDRFSDSTLVYQGYALGLGFKKIKPWVEFFSLGVKPDITFVLDIEPHLGLKRIQSPRDRIERRGFEFHQKLREGYRILARREPGRIKIIPSYKKEEARTKILSYIEKCLKRYSVSR